MTPRVATNTLTESNTLERARLELKYKTKGLDHYEKSRRSLLLSGDPPRDLSLGAKAATGGEGGGVDLISGSDHNVVRNNTICGGMGDPMYTPTPATT